MSQTHTQSFIEAWTNVLVGYGLSLLSQLAIFYWYDIQLSLGENMLIVLWYTVLSLLRSYSIRRYYNWKHTTQRRHS